MTTKQIANLMIDTYKGVAPANFSNGLTAEQQISEAMFSAMGIAPTKDVHEVIKAFRQESVRNAVFSVVEEVLQDAIIHEAWQNPFFELFVESRSQKRGDKTVFYVKSKQELVVSRVSKDGQVSLDRQRPTDGAELTVKVETYAISVYDYIARILTGNGAWSELVMALYEAVERFIAEKCYATFVKVCDNLPTQFIHSGAYNRKQIKEKIRNVKMASGASSVILFGTGVAMDYLADEAKIDYMQSEKARVEMLENGRIGKWYGETIVELPNAFKQGTAMTELVMPDNVIFIIPNTVEKPVKLVTENILVDFDNSGLRADETLEFAIRFSFGVNVLCSSALGVIKGIN